MAISQLWSETLWVLCSRVVDLHVNFGHSSQQIFSKFQPECLCPCSLALWHGVKNNPVSFPASLGKTFVPLFMSHQQQQSRSPRSLVIPLHNRCFVLFVCPATLSCPAKKSTTGTTSPRPALISAFGIIDGLKPWDQTNPGEDFEYSAIRSTFYVFGLIAAVLLTAWHFARAWLVS